MGLMPVYLSGVHATFMPHVGRSEVSDGLSTHEDDGAEDGSVTGLGVGRKQMWKMSELYNGELALVKSNEMGIS